VTLQLAWDGITLGVHKIMPFSSSAKVRENLTAQRGILSPSNKKIDNSLDNLLPSFGAKVQVLLYNMEQMGYDPILFEGYRTPARAKELAGKGLGIANSLHIYGAAADIISKSKLWSAPNDFWVALGNEAKKLGLVWGGDFPHKPDVDHVQAISVREESRFRGLASNDVRDSYLSDKYA
jgi:hypothetical protein